MKDLFDLDFSRWEIILLSIIPALINIGIFIYVTFFLPQNRTNYTFSVFVILIGFWQLGDGFVRMSIIADTASEWNRISEVFLLFTIPAGILFSLNFSKWYKISLNRFVFISLFIPSIICLLFVIARLDAYTIIKSAHWYWIVNPEPTIITSVIYLWVLVSSLLMLAVFWLNYAKARTDELLRKQFFLLAAGFSIPAFGGLITEIILPLLSGIDAIPVSTSLFTVFSITSLLGIKKYNLLSYSPKDQWEHIVESMNEGILIADNAGRIMYANKMFCELTEYGFAEIKGKVSHELLLDDQGKKQYEKVLEDRKNNKSSGYEIQLKTKSGEKIWMQINGSPYKDKSGKVIGSIGIHTNITERKIAEQTIKVSNERYELATKATNDVIWDWDIITGRIYRSENYTEQFGYPSFSEDVYNDSWIHNLHIDDNERVMNSMLGKVNNPDATTWVSEYRFTKNNGEVAYIKDNGHIIRDEKGKALRVVGAMSDITKQKLSEVELLYEQRKLKDAQAIAHIGSWELDLANNMGKWSDEACRIYGLLPTENYQTFESFINFIHPEDIGFVKKRIEEAKLSLCDTAFDHRIVWRDGTVRYIHSESKFEFNQEGESIGLYGIAHDITERKIAEEQRTKMTNDIVSRNKDLEQFTYIVSHNLRSSVANIIGLSDALEDADLPKDLQTEFKQGLAVSVKKLDNVIKDLNSILEVKCGLSEKKMIVHFSELINDIKFFIAKMIEKERIKIITDFTETDEIMTMKNYLYSIFYNLISNSIKYRQPNIDTVIEVTSIKNKNSIELIFKDNGIGIDLEQNSDQVFGLYKRFHTQVEGKGMGLYMTKTQVETLGGRISINSKLNVGTEIKIVFEI